MNDLPTPMLTEADCRKAVRETLDALPAEFAGRLGDVAIVVQDRHPKGLLGVFDATGGVRRIVIFRELHRDTDDVRKTVLHEIGHYFGLDERRLRELGYG